MQEPTDPTIDEQFDDRIDVDVLLAQIGKPNVLAISGGRVVRRDTGVTLPVRYGYQVEVDLALNDTYTVKRVHDTKAGRSVKGTKTNVHAGEVGDVAYRASCFREEF